MKDIKDYIVNEGTKNEGAVNESTINEANHQFYAEDWYDMKTEDEVVDAIAEALSFTEIYDSLSQSINNELDPHIFTKNSFSRELAKRIYDDFQEYYDINEG